MIDFLIVIIYFIIIFITAFSGRIKKDISSEDYFLSSRNLRWPSIAVSTIATNIQGYQFLGMMGSAYLFGLAQASLEINALQGILIAAFVFVPLYLKEKITTITEFIKIKLGNTVALFYSLTNITLFSTITIGAALFWVAYAADLVFGEQLSFINENRIYRIAIMIIFLGFFSAIYTYMGGLTAVVKTDIIQFTILVLSGVCVLSTTIYHLGGWGQLYELSPDKMHLHLPIDHKVLPWTHLFGLFFLNINYWCANQSIMQRAIAAKNLGHAQAGLMIGGLLKYGMAILIVIPGIALYSLLDEPLLDPDMAFPYIVNTYVPTGLKGVILCGLFASLMSTVDSTFNSLATLWSVDIYSKYLKKDASEKQKIQAGKNAILVSLLTGLLMGLILLYLKFENPNTAFTHTLNELRYYINCGIVVLICTSVIVVNPKAKWVLFSFLLTLPINLMIQAVFPEINYFVRAFFVVISGLIISFLGSWSKLIIFNKLFQFNSKKEKIGAIFLIISLIIFHIVFH